MIKVKKRTFYFFSEVSDLRIKKTGEFDLLQRRPSTAACRERWKEGKNLTSIGVGKFIKLSLSLTKV